MQKQLNIVIAPNPTNDLDKQIQYLKASLLYGDKITLINPFISIYSQLSDEKNQGNERSAIRLISKVIPICEWVSPDFYQKYEPIIKEYEKLVFGNHYKKMIMIHKIQLRKMIKKIAVEINRILEKVIGEERCQQLSLLAKEDILNVVDFVHPLDDKHGREQKYYTKLQSSIKDSFPVFDEQASTLIGEGKLPRTELSNELKITLPSVNDLTIAEILDLRNDLTTPLENLKNLIITFSQEIQSLSWGQEIDERWKRFSDESSPILEEVNKYMGQIGSRNNSELVMSIAPDELISAYCHVGTVDPDTIAIGGKQAQNRISETLKDLSPKTKKKEMKQIYFTLKAL